MPKTNGSGDHQGIDLVGDAPLVFGPLQRTPTRDLPASTPLAFCSWGGSRRDAFAAVDGGLWHAWSDDGSTYSSPEIFAAPWHGATSLTACSWGRGRIDVFGVDDLGAVHRACFTTTAGWIGWTDLGGGLNPATAIGAASRGRGLIDVFGLGLDKHIRQLQFENSTWSSWGSFPREIHSRGVAVAGASGRLLLATMGGVIAIAGFWQFARETGWREWPSVQSVDETLFLATELPSPALVSPVFGVTGRPPRPQSFLIARSPKGFQQAVSETGAAWRVSSLRGFDSIARPALVPVAGSAMDALTSVDLLAAGDLSFSRARVVRIENGQVVRTVDIPTR